MKYWLFYTLCFLLTPACYLIPGYRKEYLAVKLLFWNPYKYTFVCSQMLHETGKFTSRVYREKNNCFGMKDSKKGEFQEPDEDRYADYWSVYQSIYDYYDLVTNRITGYGKALNDTPTDKFKNGSGLAEHYNDLIASAFKSLGYYEASYVTYSNAINAHSKTIRNGLACFIGAVLLSLGVPSLVALVIGLYNSK